MKRAIVTGANGFVGSALITELVSHGVEVYAVIKDTNEKIDHLPQTDLVKIIYCELSDIVSLTLPEAADTFYHLAWAGTSGSDRGDYDLQINNVRFTCDAVNAAKRIGCQKFILASSIMEYEAIDYIPRQNSTPNMGYIYSTSKLAAHYMAKTLAVDLGMEFIAAVISNIYGVGEMSKRLINTTIRKIFKGEKAQFTEGFQLYDFIYITDAAKAFYLLGKEHCLRDQYYIGQRHPRPLREFLTELAETVDPSVELDFGAIVFHGVSLSYTEFDMTGLYEDFSYNPEIQFREGIKLTADWIKKRGDFY